MGVEGGREVWEGGGGSSNASRAQYSYSGTQYIAVNERARSAAM